MKYILLVVLIVATSCSFEAKCQKLTRFSLNVSTGNNQSWSSLNADPGLLWNAGITFTPHYLFITEGEFEKGELNGRVQVKGDNLPVTISKFETTYSYRGGIAGINLLKIFSPRKRNFNVIPYLYAGAGFLNFESFRYSESGGFQKRYTYNTYTTKLGFRLKVKLNKFIDCVANIETSTPQSYYVDASPVPKAYDRFTSIKLGLSYKIGAHSKRTHIDWTPRTTDKCNAWFDYSAF